MSGLYTVVIPTHNRRELVIRVVRSVARQTARELLESIIVVDDHSTDGTFEALNDLDLSVPLQVLKSRDRGTTSRNTGFEAARGEFILMLDDDVVPVPDLLLEHHRRREGVDFPHCVRGMVTWPPEVEQTPFMRFVDRHYQSRIEELAGKTEVDFTGLMTGNLSIHTQLLLDHGGLDTDYFYGFEDTDLGVRLAQSGVRILYAPEAVGYHYRTPTLKDYCRRQEAIADGAAIFARKHPEHADVVGLDRLPDPRSLRGIVKRLLINRVTEPVLGGIAGVCTRIGLIAPAEMIYHQILAKYYYRGLRAALADGDESA